VPGPPTVHPEEEEDEEEFMLDNDEMEYIMRLYEK
jgi:hypothetical protein